RGKSWLAIESDRLNSSTVCSVESDARLSNHFGTIISALAPTALPLPSISISARTKTCEAASTTTAPKRNGRAKRTGRSKSVISRTARRSGIVTPLIQRALREEVLADALDQFREDRIAHDVKRARARQRHITDRRDRAGPLGHDQHAVGQKNRFRNRVRDQKHGL